MPYKGTVRGKVIELESDVPLPDGTEVEIVVKDHEKKTVTASGHPRSSPQAILKFLDTPPLCTSDDVEALLQAIRQAKRPVGFEGIFDKN
ncbi:hypothetical protein EPO44_14375 [bacterium]|nr:MAG: hypothetical protein EPO44_14375 [bacterium]